MRFCMVLLVVAALAFAFLPGCDSGTGGDGNGDGGGYLADTLEEAQAIADPLAEAWDADALYYSVQGAELDRDGVLIGPDALTGEHDSWMFLYNARGKEVFSVFVFIDGQTTTNEDDDPGNPHIALPVYTNDHLKDLMNIACDLLEAEFGTGLTYSIIIAYNDDYDANVAMVFAADTTGVVMMDADTLEVLGTSW